MSGRPIESCEGCRDALTDFVCDELDADTRATVLAHTRDCQRCASELSRFERVMAAAAEVPLEASPARVHAAVMVAAREALARRGALATPPSRNEAEALMARLRAWFSRAGTWAMSPQVAMVSVLLLMLGVGLLALPPGHQQEQTALRAAEEHDDPRVASGAALPPSSSPPEPAMVLERQENEESKAPPDGASSGAAPARPGGSKRSKPMARTDSATLGPTRSAKSAPAKPAAKKAESLAQAPPADAFPGSPAEAKAQERTQALAADEGFASAPPEASGARAGRANAAEPESSELDDSPETLLLAQGLRAAQAGDHAGAIALLKPLANKASPALRREVARSLAHSYRALGKCRDALPYYELLTNSLSVAPNLLVEAADCYEQTGATKQAATLRTRAQLRKGTGSPNSAKPATAN